MTCTNCGDLHNGAIIMIDKNGRCIECGKDISNTRVVEVNRNKQIIEAIKNLLELLK